MKKNTLATIAALLLLATPAVSATDGESPNDTDIRLRQEQQMERVKSRNVMNEVQSRLPQASIADLLKQIDGITGTQGAIPAAVAGPIEADISLQRAFWYDEYRRRLAGVPASVGQFDPDSAEAVEDDNLGEHFDEAFASAVASDTSSVSPADILVIYQEYDRLATSFQQLKLARFLSANRTGVSRYKGPQADRNETAAIADEMGDSFLPVYKARVEVRVANLRKILVATSGEEKQ